MADLDHPRQAATVNYAQSPWFPALAAALHGRKKPARPVEGGYS
jgi:hypothetical protein